MTNFEKWLTELIKNDKDVPIMCDDCPVKGCMDDPSEQLCAEMFLEWSRREVDE